MVPGDLAGDGGKSSRGARIPPHDKRATRRARGLEAAVVDNEWMSRRRARPDGRTAATRCESPDPRHFWLPRSTRSASEPQDAPERLVDKDAHDIYRVLVHTPTAVARHGLSPTAIGRSRRAGDRSEQWRCFACTSPPDPKRLAPHGRTTEAGVGEPETVALQTSILAIGPHRGASVLSGCFAKKLVDREFWVVGPRSPVL